MRGGCSCGGRVSLAEVATPSTGSNAGRPNPAEATSPNAPDWQGVPCVSGAASVGSPVQGLSVEVQPPRSCVEGDDDMELYGLPGEDQHNEPHWDEPPPHKAKGQLTVEDRRSQPLDDLALFFVRASILMSGSRKEFRQ